MTEEKLQKIEKMAELPWSTAELATILEMDEHELRAHILNKSSEIGKRINIARLRTRGEFYEAVIKLSNAGSGPAQQLLNQFLLRQET